MKYNQLTTNTFISKANVIHKGKYFYPYVDYVNNYTKIKITCPSHGNFDQSPAAHLKGQGCPKCKAEKLAFDRKNTDKEIIEKFRNKHGDKYDYSLMKYINIDSHINIVCPEHGIFNQRPFDHLRGSGCPNCGYDNLRVLKLSNKQDFINKANIVHNCAYNYSKFEYKKSQIKSIIICSKHGEFYQSPNNHLRGKGCPICKASKGELTIAKILCKHNIKFIPQYRIPNNSCRFRYDFYLTELNILIEFHGIQHFKAKEFFGGEEALKNNQFRDMCKRSLAFDYRIKLIEFNYKQLKFMTKEEFEHLVVKSLIKPQGV